MADNLQLVPDALLDMEELDDNPEAIFDFITIQSNQERYGYSDTARSKSSVYSSPKGPKHEAVYVNETDFETFVQHFPIDDSIAECFAATGSEPTKQQKKFVSGGKRPQLSTKYSKLKKRFGRKPSDDMSLLSDDEARAREIKRSKKAGGVFSKRHKWRNIHPTGVKKTHNFSDQSEKSESDVVDDVFEPPRETTLNVNGETRWGSFSASDSQITSFSETLARIRNENHQETAENYQNTKHLQRGHRHKFLDKEGNDEYVTMTASVTAVVEDSDELTQFLTGNTTEMISRIQDVPPDIISSLRDENNNTILHRAVALENADLVKYVLEMFPEMTSDMNNENETAIEMAAKLGHFECLKVMIVRSQRRQSPGPSILNRLLNICAQNGQSECLSLLLQTIARDSQATCTLPGDARGNTAAHLAAKQGHVGCLHTLVAAGYDVTSENLLQQRPLQVAHQSRSHSCFEYLLLLDVCRELFTLLKTQIETNTRLTEQISGNRTSLENVRSCVHRYRDLCTESSQSLTECKFSILETITNIHSDLELCVEQSSRTKVEGLGTRDKLKELQAEIERLEDSFEFSPFTEVDAVVGKLDQCLVDAIYDTTDLDAVDSQTVDNDAERQLGVLIRDIHREYILENWHTTHVYDRYLEKPRLEYQSKPLGLTNAPAEFQNVTSFAGLGRGEPVVKGDKERTNDKQESNTGVAVHELDNISEPLDRSSSKHNTSSESNKSAERVERPAEAQSKSKEKDDDSDKENENINDPTERPFTKLMSLDERIDLLIAGERKREQEEDVECRLSFADSRTSNPGPPSLYTSTFTSITSDVSEATSDWYNKLTLDSLASTSTDDVTQQDVSYDVTTSDSASYWWDVGDKQFDVRDPRDYKMSVPYSSRDDRRRIHLNLENDGSSVDELRNQRLANHLRSVQQTRLPSETYRERITTSTGEVIGGFHATDDVTQPRVLVDVNGALRNRKQSKPIPKPRKRGKPKLFTLEDAIDVKPLNDTDFRERYERPGDAYMRSRWDDVTLANEEELSLSWSDISTRRGHDSSRSDVTGSYNSCTLQGYV